MSMITEMCCKQMLSEQIAKIMLNVIKQKLNWIQLNLLMK